MLKVIKEIELKDFEYWSGAVNTAETITKHDKWDLLENILSEIYEGGMTETQLNDLFWHEAEYLYELVGIEVEYE